MQKLINRGHIAPKGFTLIELLVVIAIIGILAGIVLASLGSARNKGADAGVQGTLSNMRAQAELFSTNNGTSGYNNLCTNSTISSALSSALSAGGATSINTTAATAGSAATVTCHASSTGWAIEAPLKTSGFFCVDWTGASATTSASTLAANDSACN